MGNYTLSHLKQLEAESIHIMREVVAEFDNPVMMYSIGKDSSVMLHLARKASRAFVASTSRGYDVEISRNDCFETSSPRTRLRIDRSYESGRGQRRYQSLRPWQ